MKNGFTLMELIVVVIIIGILAMIGLPQFFKVVERSRTAEAAQVLGEIRAAQLRYYTGQGNYTTNCIEPNNDLDVNFASLKYFNAASIVCGTEAASIERNGGSYTMRIEYATGNLTCSSGTCPAGY